MSPVIRDIDAALAALGATGEDGELVSSESREALDVRGWVVLEAALDDVALATWRTAFEQAPGAAEETGTRHVELEVGREPWLSVLTEPRVLSCVYHVLARPFRLLQAGGRDPRPGYGLQGLHADWMPRAPGEPSHVVTALWLLDQFTERNGATRVVSGTHLLSGQLPKALRAPSARHPDEERVLARAGSVLLFNGHLWHGGTQNEGDGPRRIVQTQFVARASMGPPDPVPTLAGTGPRSAAARYLLGG